MFRPVLLDVTPKPATSDLSPKVVPPTCAVLSGLNLQTPICPKTAEKSPTFQRAFSKTECGRAIMVREPDAPMQPAPQDNQLMSKHRVLGFKP